MLLLGLVNAFSIWSSIRLPRLWIRSYSNKYARSLPILPMQNSGKKSTLTSEQDCKNKIIRCLLTEKAVKDFCLIGKSKKESWIQ